MSMSRGLHQIAGVFLETAEQERQHAKWLFRLMNNLKLGTKINVEAEVHVSLGSTVENLKAAIDGENHEHTSMYPGFARTAEEEGLNEISARLRAISIAEKYALGRRCTGSALQHQEGGCEAGKGALQHARLVER